MATAVVPGNVTYLPNIHLSCPSHYQPTTSCALCNARKNGTTLAWRTPPNQLFPAAGPGNGTNLAQVASPDGPIVYAFPPKKPATVKVAAAPKTCSCNCDCVACAGCGKKKHETKKEEPWRCDDCKKKGVHCYCHPPECEHIDVWVPCGCAIS